MRDSRKGKLGIRENFGEEEEEGLFVEFIGFGEFSAIEGKRGRF